MSTTAKRFIYAVCGIVLLAIGYAVFVITTDKYALLPKPDADLLRACDAGDKVACASIRAQ